MMVAVYIRVGSADQFEPPFIRQEQKLRAFAEKHDMEVAGIFCDMSSGMSFDRPGWKMLLSELSTNHFDAVLTQDLSRIGRGTLPTLKAIEEIERRGSNVICVNGDHLNVEATKQMMQKLESQFKKQRKKA